MRILPPHKIISREVKADDLDRLMPAVGQMLKLVNQPIGMYGCGYALAHSQVTKDDPLRFFVLNILHEKFRGFGFPAVIINPVITRHSSFANEKEEGCLSFANLPMIKVRRWNKLELQYQTVRANKNNEPIDDQAVLTEPVIGKYSGIIAQIVQHEMNHLDGVLIYPI